MRRLKFIEIGYGKRTDEFNVNKALEPIPHLDFIDIKFTKDYAIILYHDNTIDCKKAIQ